MGDADHKKGYKQLRVNLDDREDTDCEERNAQEPPSRCRDLRALRNLFLSNPLHLLLVVVPVALACPWLHWSDEVVFITNFVAILPLASLLGGATEELAGSVGQTLGGFLNATFGNAVEMILSVFALRDGLVDVVQGSLLGSILSNLLLVLGCCFTIGGLKFHTQVYNANGARVQASLLLLAVLAMVVPSISSLTHSKDQDPELELLISRGSAVILGVLYGLYLWFQLRTHPEHFQPEGDEDEEVNLSPVCATMVLLLSTLVVAICSEGLVGSVEGMTERLHVSRTFVGVIMLPIVGNAAEHATAVTVAYKNKMDLAIGVTLGSSSQIALFVVPFTVLVGWMMDVKMTLNFGPVMTGILLLSVLVVGNLTNDGESNWLEGSMLLAAYTLIAVTFWFL